MKKIIFGLIVTVTFGFVSNAQTFEKPQLEIIHDTELSRLISEKLLNLDSSSLLQAQKYLEVEKISPENFNTEEVYKEELKEFEKTVYTVNLNEDKFKFGFCVIVDDKTNLILNSSFVKITTKTIEHFFIEDVEGFKLTKTDKESVILKSTYGKKGLGQQLIDCINDAYSNHGWYSTALFIGTLFEPWVGGGVAYLCYCHVFGM